MLLGSIIGYLVLTILIGAFASRFVNSSGDFMLAGRSLPLFLSASALFATWFGSETVLGATSEFLEHGATGIIEDPFGAALCLILYGIFFARPLYKMNLLTINDLFRVKYGQKIELLSALFLIPSYFSWIAAQLVALGLILHTVAGTSLVGGVWISTVIVTFYTALGGMWAVSVTDFVQSIIIVLGLVILLAVLLVQTGGIVPVINAAPEGFFRIHPAPDLKSCLVWFAGLITIGLGSIPSQDVFQRAMSSKSDKVAQNSSILGGLLYLSVALIPLVIVLCAKFLHPEMLGDDNQNLIPSMVLKHTHIAIQIIFFGSLLSAILSTTSAAILAPASVLSENIIKPRFTDLTEKGFMRTLRICVILIACIAATMASFRTNIYELTGEASAFSLVSIFIPMVAAVYLPSFGRIAAFCSMTGGFVVWLICHIAETGYPAILYGLAGSIAGLLAGRLFEKRADKSVARDYVQ
jgi:solute:Na+ symporter, SSS family